MKSKGLFLLTLFFLIWIQGSGQERVTVRAGDNLTEALSTSRYLFPQFQDARVVLKDRTLMAKMNYNALSGQMEFMDANGQILELSENVLAIVFGERMFQYTSKGYMEVLADDPIHKLLVHTRYSEGDRKKQGAFGTYSSTTAISSYSTIDTDTGVKALTPNEEVTYTKKHNYYLFFSGKYTLANKASFTKNFGKQRPQMEQYLKEFPVNFTNHEDLKRLFLYCTQE